MTLYCSKIVEFRWAHPNELTQYVPLTFWNDFLTAINTKLFFLSIRIEFNFLRQDYLLLWLISEELKKILNMVQVSINPEDSYTTNPKEL
jgi:hypothetical protein